MNTRSANPKHGATLVTGGAMGAGYLSRETGDSCRAGVRATTLGLYGNPGFLHYYLVKQVGGAFRPVLTAISPLFSAFKLAEIPQNYLSHHAFNKPFVPSAGVRL